MPATPRRLWRSVGAGAGDVVGDEHGGGSDVFEFHHLAGHIEIHHVAAVIAVQAQHARAAVGRANGIGHGFGAGRGEDVADGAGVQQAGSDIAGEDGEVAGAAAGDDADFTGDGSFRPGEDAAFGAAAVEITGMGGAQAFHHLDDVIFRPVEYLLHDGLSLSADSGVDWRVMSPHGLHGMLALRAIRRKRRLTFVFP